MQVRKYVVLFFIFKNVLPETGILHPNLDSNSEKEKISFIHLAVQRQFSFIVFQLFKAAKSQLFEESQISGYLTNNAFWIIRIKVTIIPRYDQPQSPTVY